MAEFPSKVSTRTSSPAQGAGASISALRPDLGFVRSILGVLMLLQLVSARGAPGGSGFWRALVSTLYTPDHTGPHTPFLPVGPMPPRSLSPRKFPLLSLRAHAPGTPVQSSHSNAPAAPQVVTRGHPQKRSHKSLSLRRTRSLSLQGRCPTPPEDSAEIEVQVSAEALRGLHPRTLLV